MWLEPGHGTTPLVLICDFAMDVVETLLALWHGHDALRRAVPASPDDAQWVSGREVLNAAAAEPRRRVFPGIWDGLDLTKMPEELLESIEQPLATLLFLVDFSSVPLRECIGGAADERRLGAAVEAIEDFNRWVNQHRHRVVVGMTRAMLAAPQVQAFVVRAHPTSFAAADLFGGDPAERVKRCEELAGRSLPAGLKRLLGANSNTLAHEVAAFVREGGLPEDCRSLAERLVHRGFFEISCRLGLYDPAADHDPLPTQSGTPLIALDADLHQGRAPNNVVALIQDVANLPRFVERAALIGAAGSGKTVALQRIEREWALPPDAQPGRRHPCWLPLYLSPEAWVAGGSAATDTIPLPAYFGTWLPEGTRAEELQWAFSSPVLFLLDGIDVLPEADQRRLEGILAGLATSWREAGFLVAARTQERCPRLPGARIASMRPMVEGQIEKFVLGSRAREYWDQLRTLLGQSGRSISSHLRNPFLLDKACVLAAAGADLPDLNLYGLMDGFVRERLAPAEPDTRAMAYSRLAEVALEQRRRGLARTDGQDFELLALQRAGLLRSAEAPVRFAHGLVRDYFAACRLAAELPLQGTEYLRDLLSALELRRDWLPFLQMLCGRLENENPELLGDVIRWLTELDPRIAQRCCAELTRDAGALSRVPTDRLLGRIATPVPDVKQAVEDAEALGGIDPRLNLDAPLEGMVPIQSKSAGEFMAGRYPVTNLEFARFVEDRGYEEERFWLPVAWEMVQEKGMREPLYIRQDRLNRPNYPVVGISLYEALAYCSWLSERTGRRLRFVLPSERQWLAIAGVEDSLQSTAMALGEELRRPKGLESPDGALGDRTGQQDRLADRLEGFLSTHQRQLAHGDITPVGLFSATSAGCHDVFGSVWQWCDEWTVLTESARRPSEDRDLPHLPAMVKGGPGIQGIWALIGGSFDPQTRFHQIGFRVCCAARGRISSLLRNLLTSFRR